MRYKTNNHWYKTKLNIKFKELTQEEETAKYEKELTNLHTSERDESEIISLIRSSVYLDIWTTIDFKVIDENAYVVGYLGLLS